MTRRIHVILTRISHHISQNLVQGSRGAGEQRSRGAGEQGSRGAREQGRVQCALFFPLCPSAPLPLCPSAFQACEKCGLRVPNPQFKSAKVSVTLNCNVNITS
ncbi:MAG: hypothetical protein V7L23_35580 [Nostoc sp.]|uniref:hypothetical protein n=1 Tax=Nostoc sp. TaxID=1180 RepID=UPI002FF17961